MTAEAHCGPCSAVIDRRYRIPFGLSGFHGIRRSETASTNQADKDAKNCDAPSRDVWPV